MIPFLICLYIALGLCTAMRQHIDNKKDLDQSLMMGLFWPIKLIGFITSGIAKWICDEE